MQIAKKLRRIAENVTQQICATDMDTPLNWLFSNEYGFYNGLGATTILAVTTYLINRFFKKKNNSSEKSSQNVKVKDSKNVTVVGGDLTIKNPKKKLRPILEVEIILLSSGKTTKGLSWKNPEGQVIQVGHGIYDYELYWDYNIRIINASNAIAFSLEIIEVSPFTYVEKLDRLTPLRGLLELKIEAKFRKHTHLTGVQANEELSEKFPPELKPIKIKLKYFDEERNEFFTEFVVNENQDQINTFEL